MINSRNWSEKDLAVLLGDADEPHSKVNYIWKY